MKKYILVTIFSILILVISIGTYKYVINPTYVLDYQDFKVPGSESIIKISGNKVKVTTTNYCSSKDCKPTIIKKTYTYSKKNIKNIKKFVNKKFPLSRVKKYQINYNTVNKRQREIINGILLGEYYFEISYPDYKYKIEYEENDTNTYIIYLNENNKILVKKLTSKDYSIIKSDDYILKFSKDNTKKLYDYVEKEAKTNESNYIIKSGVLFKDEINIYKSIIENDESYLENLDKAPKVLYAISYGGINCDTPVLYLYSDNTYEYYYTFTLADKKPTPKTGTYNYDMKKLIDNVNNYQEDVLGPYSIYDLLNEKSYTTYSSNIELNELLKSIDRPLAVCLEQE